MEVAMEMEDDVFFADLNKQISLLIMDDDEEDPLAQYPSVSLQAFSRAIRPATQPPFSYHQNCTTERESKGTGVFIPQSSHQRRKNRQGKYSSSNSKFHRNSHDNSRKMMIPHESYMNNIPPHSSHYSKKQVEYR